MLALELLGGSEVEVVDDVGYVGHSIRTRPPGINIAVCLDLDAGLHTPFCLLLLSLWELAGVHLDASSALVSLVAAAAIVVLKLCPHGFLSNLVSNVSLLLNLT